MIIHYIYYHLIFFLLSTLMGHSRISTFYRVYLRAIIVPDFTFVLDCQNRVFEKYSFKMYLCIYTIIKLQLLITYLKMIYITYMHP